jgi:putative endonuclease
MLRWVEVSIVRIDRWRHFGHDEVLSQTALPAVTEKVAARTPDLTWVVVFFGQLSLRLRLQPGLYLTQRTLKTLDWLAERFLPSDSMPPHQRTGRKGEEAAYFYLRRLGYVMVGRNFRSPHRRGEIDLIGWDDDVLCFIEVKTRTSHDVKPAETAVDRDKLRELNGVAQQYLRHLRREPPWRIDIVSVYVGGVRGALQIELFKNATGVA